MATVGALLRMWRIRAGLSQKTLSQQAGIDPAYLNKLELAPPDSAASPSRRVTLSLASALDLAPIETDRLLIAAGRVPEIVLRMSERQLRAVYTLLGEDLVEPARLRTGS